MPITKPGEAICKHCHREIKHLHEHLWHEVGALVFPQYCVTDFGGKLHEPVETISTKEKHDTFNKT